MSETMPIPTLAALKRLPVGTELYCIRNHSGPCRLYRRIVKMQTNAFVYVGDGIPEGKRSWTHWRSAKQFEATSAGFRLYYDDKDPSRYIEYELSTTGGINANLIHQSSAA